MFWVKWIKQIFVIIMFTIKGRNPEVVHWCEEMGSGVGFFFLHEIKSRNPNHV